MDSHEHTDVNVLNRRAANSLRGRVAVYVVGATGLILFCAALAVLDACAGVSQLFWQMTWASSLCRGI